MLIVERIAVSVFFAALLFSLGAIMLPGGASAMEPAFTLFVVSGLFCTALGHMRP